MPARTILAAVSVAAAMIAVSAPLLGSFWMYMLLRPVCSQDLERSLWLAGAPMALCARCLGIYMGAALGALVSRGRAGPRRFQKHIWLAVALMAADAGTEWLGLRPAWAAGRFLTGFLFGYSAASLLPGIRQTKAYAS